MLLLVSPSTIEDGATQWMELAYADAFDVTIFVLLHHLDLKALRERRRGVADIRRSIEGDGS